MSPVYKTSLDYTLLFVTVAILSIGLLMVFSASPTMALRLGDSFYYLKRHIFAVTIGLLALYSAIKLDREMLQKGANYIIAIAIALLVIVLIPGIGVGIGGASRWIYLGFLSFQPAEVAKLALIIFLAKELSSKSLNSSIGTCLGITLLIALLIIKQPDLGTMIIIVGVAFIMLFLAGLPIKSFYYLALPAIASIIILSLAKPYRFRRIIAYLNPWSDPKGVGFHIIQSLIAVGSGGFLGAGLGGSKQKFFYLPQNYTDFIFAIFCEEMGFLGAIGVIILFFFFISRGIKIARSSPDAFSMLLAGGIVAWIGFQALLNISVVLGIAPTTGIPLPLISYGGTSIVTMLFSIGLLLNISQDRNIPQQPGRVS